MKQVHCEDESSDSQNFEDLQTGIEGYDDIREFLRDWAIHYKLRREPVEDLLHFLRKTGLFPELPLSLRTLVGTPTYKKTK